MITRTIINDADSLPESVTLEPCGDIDRTFLAKLVKAMRFGWPVSIDDGSKETTFTNGEAEGEPHL